MRRRIARFVIAGMGLAACGPTIGRLPARAPELGTVRVIAGQRVEGHYVSPAAYEHYARAELASLAGRDEEAAGELRRAISSDGTSHYLWTRLAEELLTLGRADEARDALGNALRLDPEFAEAYVDLGRVELTLGDGAAAEGSFRRAFAIDPALEDAYLALAQLYRERGDGVGAEQVYRELGERVPGSAAAHYQAARSWARRGDGKRVEAELLRSLELDAGNVDSARLLGALWLAAGRDEDAETVLQHAFTASGGDVQVAGMLREAQLAAGQVEAAAALVDALVDTQGGTERRLQIGWLLVAAGLPARALELTEALGRGLVPSDAQPELDELRGAALAAMHRDPEACTALRRVPESSARFASAQGRLARVLLDGERDAEAITLLVRALKIVASLRAPDLDALTTLLAEAHEHAGDRPAALALFEAARKERPTDGALVLAEARALARGGDWQGALRLTQPLELHAKLGLADGDIELLRFVAGTLLEHAAGAQRKASVDEAVALLERATRLAPEDAHATADLGAAYLAADRLADAERELTRARRRLPDSPSLLAHLGALYLRRNDRDAALDALRRALAQKPDELLRHVVEDQLLLLEKDRVGSR